MCRLTVTLIITLVAGLVNDAQSAGIRRWLDPETGTINLWRCTSPCFRNMKSWMHKLTLIAAIAAAAVSMMLPTKARAEVVGYINNKAGGIMFVTD